MIRRVLMALSVALFTTSAHAATIDFEAQTGGYGYAPYSFVEDGFQISYSPISPFGFYILDDPADNLGMCNPGCASNGTTALYAFNESSVTIDLANGGLFSLASLDAAGTFTQLDRPLTLTLTGTGVGGVVTDTIFLSAEAAESFTNFAFDGFADISSLTITGGPDFPEFAIDNLVLFPSAVPEPATWGLLILGFGVVAGAMRRRKVSTSLRFA